VEVLQQASQRGIAEEDTSTIVQSMLVDLLGYDRFKEISGQYAVRGRWADWAVKVDDAIQFFVEVKPLGAKARDRDLFQVVAYSRQENLEWAVLTTGDLWQCHRVASGQEPEEFFEVRLLDPSFSVDDAVDRLYLLSKEASSRGALQERWAQRQCFRPEKLGRLLLSDDVLTALRRILRRDNPGQRIEVANLREALARGVIRGDLYDAIMQTPGDDSSQRRRRAARKAWKTRKQRLEAGGQPAVSQTEPKEPEEPPAN
jgi:hypothetical protein